MAKITINGYSDFSMSRMNFSSLFFGSHYVERPTLFQVKYFTGAMDEFRGTGFQYDKQGTPIDGTVTKYTAYIDNYRLLIVDKLRIDAEDIADAAQTLAKKDDTRVLMSALDGNDLFIGNNGQNTIWGYGGDDRMFGGGDSDKLYGGNGDDILVGGGYTDRLTGESGADVFVFKQANHIQPSSRSDVITDFSSRQRDTIDFSGIDANEEKAGNQAFKFIGQVEFHERAGELRYERENGNVYVSGDTDGDGDADFTLVLQDVAKVARGDFDL